MERADAAACEFIPRRLETPRRLPPAVRRTAERLLRAHPLHAADGLQLAAALIAADHNPGSLEILCLDARLARAAEREGFVVLS